MRRLQVSLAVAICLSACGGAAVRPLAPGTSTPDQGSSPGPAAAGQVSPAPGAQSPGGGGTARPATGNQGGGGTSGGGAGGGGQGASASPDAGDLGSMSRGFLRPSPYSNINLEVDVAGDAAPSAAVVSNIVGVLNRETSKSVSQTGGHGLAGHGSGCWTDTDIAAVASQRSAHTGGATASMLTLFLDGSYCPDANVLGMAIGATSLLVFSTQVENLATLTIGPDQFMKSVTTHELGHVLGLINLGYQSRISHEDSAHPHHSSNQNSVMYWAIEQRNLIQQFVQGPPQNFDSDDEADLAGLRAGAY